MATIIAPPYHDPKTLTIRSRGVSHGGDGMATLETLIEKYTARLNGLKSIKSKIQQIGISTDESVLLEDQIVVLEEVLRDLKELHNRR
jgi:hypothetical protein